MREPARDWLFQAPLERSASLERIDRHYLDPEEGSATELVARARLDAGSNAAVLEQAKTLVAAMRSNRAELGGLDAFMSEYDLSSTEGIVLMCLAEALLRIPDAETADRLIADKLADADFESHLGTSDSLFVNASTWALMLTGRLVDDAESEAASFTGVLEQTLNRLGEPVIRAAMRRAMRILGHQFVMGRSIDEGLERARAGPAYRYSFDMLGEAALTADDAQRYLDAYRHAIAAVGATVGADRDLAAAPSVSVKLSALDARFELAQRSRTVAALADRLRVLALAAREQRVALTVDAEEADRLGLTLEVFERVLRTPELAGWPGLGLAVQAYQKRAIYVIEWLAMLAEALDRTVPVRLVKGAYWDTEIKRAQEQGLAGYPVFTRKSSTDVSYLACAGALLESPQLYPQFATHNAHTVAWVLQAGADKPFEFQRLHGMGEELYTAIVGRDGLDRPCRVYAPVGSHEDLLPYLVRRLLENGANTSFVNRFVHDEASIDEIVEDPVEQTARLLEAGAIAHPRIAPPREIYGRGRRNSEGVNLADLHELAELRAALVSSDAQAWRAAPLVDGVPQDGELETAQDPTKPSVPVGELRLATAATAIAALDAASAFAEQWDATPAVERAARLRAAADLLQARRAELVVLCVREGGRSVPDSLAEIREAIDFLRYYANEAERLFGAPIELPGPTGESNALRLAGRGVFLCISPWNFPVAIFTGQIAAALAAGNPVLAKPAESTSIVAGRVVALLHEAGVPARALHFLPGRGAVIGEALLPDARLAGVAFTGSSDTAKRIERTLAARDGPIATLIAETGGINAMLVDSSALPEQVVRDACQSAFNSAGQRCSALRVLCLQSDTAERVVGLLKGHMDELVIGDPALLQTDVGPVIDAEAERVLSEYVTGRGSRVVYRCGLDAEHAAGTFVAPTLVELDTVSDLRREIFGPVLHLVRYEADEIDALIDDLNGLGFGLTLGVHSRIDSFAAHIAARARVGNVYVNRNMIGAVVGVQPFGGTGLSGTGPKAGGPHYLLRFAREQTVTVNTAAVGGNASLLAMAGE